MSRRYPPTVYAVLRRAATMTTAELLAAGQAAHAARLYLDHAHREQPRWRFIAGSTPIDEREREIADALHALHEACKADGTAFVDLGRRVERAIRGRRVTDVDPDPGRAWSAPERLANIALQALVYADAYRDALTDRQYALLTAHREAVM